MSGNCQEGLDTETAYILQKEFVAKCLEEDEQAGFKAGLTSKAAQEKGKYRIDYGDLGIIEFTDE